MGKSAEILAVKRDLTDHSLLRRFQTGENEAATRLYVKYAQRLERLAAAEMSGRLRSRLDPEDVVQSVFRTFFRRAKDPLFRSPSGDQLWQLLLVIAMNKVRKLGRFHRQKKRSVDQTVSVVDEATPASGAEFESLTILEIVLDETLSDLPDAQRQMIELRIQGNTINEISKITNRCTRTVERVLHRFRERMQEVVEDRP